MRRKVSVPVVFLIALALVTAGCLDGDEDDDGNGNEPPPEGTTEGFTFPDFSFTDRDSIVRQTNSWGGDYTIFHVIGSAEDAFEPQFAQIRAALEHFDNITVKAVTMSSGNDTLGEMELLASSVKITWAFGLPLTDLEDELSLVRPLTVFVLDTDHVIIERADDILGQGRIIEAIEATWGVEPPEDAYPEVGSTVQDLVWRDVDGVEGRLSYLEGSPVILNVWEMECPFCLELFTELEKVRADHSADDLEMVSIDLITWETPEQVRGVRERYNATWTFAIDGDNIQSRYDIWRLPLLVLLDPEGVVQWVWTGYAHSSVISGEVEKLI